MKLFLASEVKNPKSIEKLREVVGGFEGKKIAYIPTAANGERGWGSWKEGGSWKLVNTLGSEITLVQLEDYRNNSVIKLLEGKDIIWLAGGCPGYLMYWVKRTEIDKNLPRLLNEGAWYVGSSAGAMVAGKSLDAAEWSFVDNEIGASKIPTLGLVDFDIYPHYEDDLLEKIKQNHKRNKLYLLKNGEEIIVEDGKMQVIGEERVVGNLG